MNTENNIDLVNIIKILWLNKKSIIRYSMIGLFIGLVISISIPNEYTTTVKIAPEDKNVNISGSMGALANMIGVNTSSNNEGITKDIYPEIIKSTPFALEFAHIPVVYNDSIIPFWQYQLDEQKKPWWSSIISLPVKTIDAIKNIFTSDEKTKTLFNESNELQTNFVSNFSKIINLTIDKKTSVISASITTQEPNISANIADSVILKLQKYMTSYRTAQIRSSLKYNSKMMQEVQTKYYKLDHQYAQMLDKNTNIKSHKAKMYLKRLENERNLTKQIYQQLSTQVALDKIKLNEQISIATVIEPAIVPIYKSAPNRFLTLIAFIFIACVIKITIVIYRELQK